MKRTLLALFIAAIFGSNSNAQVEGKAGSGGGFLLKSFPKLKLEPQKIKNYIDNGLANQSYVYFELVTFRQC